MNLSNADTRLFLPLNPENFLFMPSAYWLFCHTFCSWKTSQSVIGSSPGHFVTACVVYNAGRSIVKPAGKASIQWAFLQISEFNECSPLCHFRATTKVPCSKWCPQNSNESTRHQPAPYSWFWGHETSLQVRLWDVPCVPYLTPSQFHTILFTILSCRTVL